MAADLSATMARERAMETVDFGKAVAAATIRRAAWVALAWLGCGLVVAVADAAGPGRPAGSEAPASPPADLKIANRHIVTLRADAFGAPPAERVRVISSAVPALVDRGGALEVSTAPIQGGVAVLIDGMLVFRILDGDVNRESGETANGVAVEAARNLETALAEIREARDSRALLPAIGYSLLATLLAFVALWLIWRVQRSVIARLRSFGRKKRESLLPRWSSHLVGAGALERLLVVPAGLLAWLLALFVVYNWLGFLLERFPYTRPWGEALFDNLFAVLASLATGVAGALPGLFFAALIFYLTRVLTRAVRAFFDGVEAGRIPVAWVDEVTARPTSRLINAVIWLFAFVAAYPYIPGTSSEAFKGIGVFVGLMLSIGSSGIVNQAVSGLMLMYTRALRPGEFVKIGETEGTVKSVGFVNTRIETLRHEEVSIPNAVVAATVTHNYSRLAGDGGVAVPTKVTIGYDTPWRQVQSMLLLAAERTQTIAREVPPRVLQTALLDFYVEYTLLVRIADPAKRLTMLGELHGHIQDVFNEHGVQIMSPNYETDPAEPKLVPPEKWYSPPAQR
jgi:small-conductance mechanosensitive channel